MVDNLAKFGISPQFLSKSELCLKDYQLKRQFNQLQPHGLTFSGRIRQFRLKIEK